MPLRLSTLQAGTTLEIDGFPLILLQVADHLELGGNPGKRLYDGQPSTLLDTAISLVTSMASSNEDNWAKILAGDGVTYGVAGCVPAARYEIDDSKAITYFTWAAGKPPDGPMWNVFFEHLGGPTLQTFIPYGTLETILALAIDVAHGNDVELPAHAVVGPKGAASGDPTAT